MTAIRNLAGRIVRRMAPETMRTLEYAGSLRQLNGRLPEVVAKVDDLLVRLDLVERRLEELDGIPAEVDELRRDSLRIAELTDLVLTTLAVPPPPPAGPR